jgi:hypothetical protein
VDRALLPLQAEVGCPRERILKRFGHHIPLHFAMNKLRCDVCKGLGAEIYLGELPNPVDLPDPGAVIPREEAAE